jgi:hypothetical protein
VLALIIALADTFAAPPARLALSPVSTGKQRLGMKFRFSRNRSALLREPETPSRLEHFAASARHDPGRIARKMPQTQWHGLIRAPKRFQTERAA